MKIESNPKIPAITNPQLKKAEKNHGQKSFGEILAETVNPSSSQNNKLAGPPPVSELNPLHYDAIRDGLERTQITAKLERLLDVLDQYRMHLENPQVSLKQMNPLAQELTSKLEELTPMIERLDQQDPLKSILNETLITTALEVKKFENGWYNPL